MTQKHDGTCHFACDCRERIFSGLEAENGLLRRWVDALEKKVLGNEEHPIDTLLDMVKQSRKEAMELRRTLKLIAISFKPEDDSPARTIALDALKEGT